MQRPKLTKKIIEKAIIGSSGLISTIAQKLNVSRVTVRNYLKKYPELEDLIIEEKENILDFTESKLIKKIQEEESWAIKYLLSTQGRKRGYGKEPAEELPRTIAQEVSEEERKFLKSIGVYVKPEEEK